jgi:hypothetical protein
MARQYPSQADLEGGQKDPERITVENVNHPGQTTRVDAAKYAAMRSALLRVLPARSPGLTQAEMSHAVLRHLPREHFPGGAKAGWWTKTVQLDLEAKGLVVRDATKPLRWRRV